MIDIVFPNKNEEKFIELAEKLGHEGLIFVYEKKTDISHLEKKTKLRLLTQTAKCVLQNPKRDLLEKSEDIIVYGLEDQEKDFLNQRNSGLNEILAKIAKQNKITIGFSFSLILNAKKRHIILGRMMQNAKICKKNGLKTIFASFAKNPNDMRSFEDLKSFAKSVGLRYIL